MNPKIKISNSIGFQSPVISVVIPLYNKGRYVKRTIDSVLSQEFQDFEVIVVDDGSTDDGPEIVKQFDDRRIRIVTQENAGVSAARNRGIQEAQADLIAFLDADDEWLPDFIETVVGLAERFPDAGAYATGYRMLKGGEHVYRNMTIRGGREKCGCYFDLLRKGIVISASSVAVRRSVFDRVAGFRVGYQLGEDLDMWFRIGLYYKFACSPKVCALYYYGLPDNACHAVTPSGDHPLRISLSEMKENACISPSIKSKAMKYCAHKLIADVELLVLRGFREVGKWRLRSYRQTFGINSSFIRVLLLLSIFPPALLRFVVMIRLSLVRCMLTLRSVNQRMHIDLLKKAHKLIRNKDNANNNR